MKRRLLILLAVMALLMAGLFVWPVGSTDTKNKTTTGVTFNKEVAPIFYRSCAECHRPGEIAPMSLLTYKEVRPWAKAIRERVLERAMPPWHADPKYGEWRNDRRLKQAELDTIVAWVDGGAPEGAAKDLPPAPEFVTGWNIGQPEETFSIPEQSVPAEGVVKYQYFTVPTNFKEDRWITAAEIRSSGRSVVHHVIVFIQEAGSTNPQGRLLVGTAPGEQPTVFPAGYGKRIPAGANLVFQVHYTPNGSAAKDVTTVGLIYAKAPVKHAVLTRPILQAKFAIPPGDPNYEVRSTYTFNEDVRVTSFMPHMHLRGKDFEYRAIFPDGTTKVLLAVPKYDFNWQTYYVPKETILLPKGTRIECLAHFDNSPNNKFNPDPTKEVRWGDQTWEEMMIGWISYHRVEAAEAKPASAGTAASAPGPK